MASKIDKKDEAQFTKEALLKSKSFEKYKDLLNVILEDDKYYTNAQVQKMIEKEMKRKVI
jgi:hypothetical protein